MRGLALIVGLFAMVGLVGCSSAPTPTPITPEAEARNPLEVTPPPPDPDALGGNQDVPRSIRRLVAEQRDEVRSIHDLATELPDRRGRARALQEAQDLAEELSSIEAQIGSARTDSFSLDEVVVRLHRLETRTGLIHDALRQATL